jgi:hypothetical protein
VPRLARSSPDELVRVPETHTGSRRGQYAQAAAGRPRPDKVGLDKRDRLAGPGQLNGRDDAGNTTADDDGV